MKAKIIDGKIKQGLPKYYKHWAGGFNTLPDIIHEQEGFYHVIKPSYNNILQYLGEIYQDGNTFTYPVLQRVLDSLNNIKLRKYSELKSYRREASNIISTYREFNSSASSGFLDARIAFINEYQTIKSELQVLSTQEDAIQYIVSTPTLKDTLETLETFI